eukprot:5286043-Prymnesium_polylepis.1
MRPPKDQATAAFVGRLEKEIRAAVEAGPPPGMSKRQWERVQIAAKKQLAILDDHPDVFKDQGAKEVRPARRARPASPRSLPLQHALRVARACALGCARPLAGLPADRSPRGARSSRSVWSASSLRRCCDPRSARSVASSRRALTCRRTKRA